MNKPVPGQKPVAAAVLGRAVVRAAQRLELTQKDVAAMLGLSPATVSRLYRGRPVDAEGKEGELALLFLRLYRSLDALLGGEAANMRRWMHAPNVHLEGTPAELIHGITGLLRVVEYLDAMRGKL